MGGCLWFNGRVSVVLARWSWTSCFTTSCGIDFGHRACALLSQDPLCQPAHRVGLWDAICIHCAITAMSEVPQGYAGGSRQVCPPLASRLVAGVPAQFGCQQCIFACVLTYVLLDVFSFGDYSYVQYDRSSMQNANACVCVPNLPQCLSQKFIACVCVTNLPQSPSTHLTYPTLRFSLPVCV